MEWILDQWYYFFPRELTTAEKVQLSQNEIKKRESEMRRKLGRLQIELEDATKACTKCAQEGNMNELRRLIMNQVKLEKEEAYVQRQLDKFRANMNHIDRMLNDQAQNKAMLNVMSLVTEDAIDPHIVQSTITEYQYGKTNTDLVRELLDDALEESEEEEAEAEGGNKNFTQQDNARVETLMRLNTDLVNHKLLDNMPIIGEINPAKVLDMNQDEMLKNNSNATRELEQFLHKK
jgi:hypothetical protein